MEYVSGMKYLTCTVQTNTYYYYLQPKLIDDTECISFAFLLANGEEVRRGCFCIYF